jgi:hypothetical protein
MPACVRDCVVVSRARWHDASGGTPVSGMGGTIPATFVQAKPSDRACLVKIGQT